MKSVTLATLLAATILLSTSCSPEVSQVTYDKLNYEYKQLEKRYHLLQAESDVTLTNESEDDYVTKEQYDRLQAKYRLLVKEQEQGTEMYADKMDEDKKNESDLTEYKYKRKNNRSDIVMSTSEPFKEQKPRNKEELASEVRLLNQEIERLKNVLKQGNLDENGVAKATVSKKEFNEVMVRMTSLETENVKLKGEMEKTEKLTKYESTTKSNLEGENKRLLAQVEHYKEDNATLQKQIKEFAETKSEKEAMIFANLETDRNTLKARVGELNKENKKLKGELSKSHRMADKVSAKKGVSKKEYENLQKKLVAAEAENKKLKERPLASAGGSKPEVSKAEYDNLMVKYNQLEKELKNKNNKSQIKNNDVALLEKVTILEAKNATLQRKIRSQEQRLGKMSNSSVSEKEYKDLKAKYEMLKKDQANAKSSTFTSTNEPLKLQRSYDELKLNYDKLMREHRALEDRFNYLNTNGKKGGVFEKKSSSTTTKIAEEIVFDLKDYKNQDGSLVVKFNMENIGKDRTLTFNRDDISIYSKEGRRYMANNYFVGNKEASKTGGVVKQKVGAKSSEIMELTFNNMNISQFGRLEMEVRIDNKPVALKFVRM